MIFNIDLNNSVRQKKDDKISIIDNEQVDFEEFDNEQQPGVEIRSNIEDVEIRNNIEVNRGDTTANKYLQHEIPEREQWSGKLDFFLSGLGYAVGLGNIWRFPYMCYRNGGGAFLIPYFLFLILVAMPLFLVDVTLGQFTSTGPFTCWEYAPLFTGIGYSMVTISALVCIYYNMIMAYSIYYMFASMANPLPWQTCNNSWNTPDCRYNLPLVSCNFTQQPDGTCTNQTTFIGLWNETLFTQQTNRNRVLPAQEYFNRQVLNISSDITVVGNVQWKLVLCLLAAWIMVFLCLVKGIKASGKIVYFTALFPYVVLIILFIRGVMLDGAGDGVAFYIIPDLQKLREASVWKDAANQIFFSLSSSWGGLIALASYNKFQHNIIRDTLLVSFGNSATSIFAGFVIFSYIGYLAKVLKTPVSKVADKGIGLAFIIYPEAVATMPGSYFWSVLFFFMLLTLGLDSQFGTVETVVTSVLDISPNFIGAKRTVFILVLCIFLFLLGLPLTTNSGPYWLQLMDTYCGGWAILLLGVFEVVSIGWIYGRPTVKLSKPMRFEKDIETMINKPPSKWWRICWQWMTPILLIGTVIFSWIDYSRAKYGDQIYPLWADFIGWTMTISSLFFIPGFVIYLIVRERRMNPYHTIKKILHNLTLPTYKWGPALPEHRLLAAKHLEDSDNYYIDIYKRIKYSEYLQLNNHTENRDSSHF